MLQTGHYGAALLLYAPVGWLLVGVDPKLAAAGAVGVVSLSMLPDIDMKLPLIAHRGVTHTFAFMVIVTGGLAAGGWQVAGELPVDRPVAAGMGAVIGSIAIGSHLVADWLTPAGIPVLWPLSSRRFGLRLVRATNPLANRGLLVVGLVASALLWATPTYV